MSEEKQYTREELEEKLTPKEKIFCEEYVVDWNKSRAARVAGYAENWAGDIGYQNSKKLYIQQYIDFIKNDLERLSGVTKLKNLQELAKIAYSNVEYIHDDWIELTAWQDIKENNPNILAAIESIDTKTETRTYPTDGEEETEIEVKYVKVKLFPKITAIQEINKMMGYNAAEKKEIITPQRVKIEFGDPENG